MPASVAAIEKYLEGAKYKRLKLLHDLLAEYGDFFDEQKNGRLLCKVTQRMVAKEGKDIERHVKGKKFTRRLEECENFEINFVICCKVCFWNL